MIDLSKLPEHVEPLVLVAILIAALGNLAQLAISPLVAWYTARRQKKVDGGQDDLKSGQEGIREQLARLDKTINGDPDAGKPAAVERVLDKQDRIIERLDRIEARQDEFRDDLAAERDARRDLSRDVRETLAIHSDNMEKMLRHFSHEARERKRAKRGGI